MDHETQYVLKVFWNAGVYFLLCSFPCAAMARECETGGKKISRSDVVWLVLMGLGGLVHVVYLLHASYILFQAPDALTKLG